MNTTTNYTVTGLGTSPGPTVNNSTGALTLSAAGTANLPIGNISYTIQMSNSAGFSASVVCYVVVSPQRALGCGTYGTGIQTVDLVAQLSGNGTLPLTYSIVGPSTLPSGLSLNTTTGVISGTVGAGVTSQSTTFRLTDRFGGTTDRTCLFTASPAPSMSCNK